MYTYAELLARSDVPAGSSWDLWGKDDELGTLNFITAETVKAAARCVRRGERFNLDLVHPTTTMDDAPEIVETNRSPAAHHIFALSTDPYLLDDYLNGFFLQGGTQVDALRHSRHHEHGFYNGAKDADIVPLSPTLGINRMAEAAVVGRGVLLDVPRYMLAIGEDFDPSSPIPISAETLDAVRRHQGVELHSGDVLMVRTGALASGNPQGAGLEQADTMLAWLWDNQFSVVAADNAALEVFPTVTMQALGADMELSNMVGLMHPTLLGLLGFTLGELWDLETLADACSRDGVYDCMVTIKPLNILGGVGSPANVIAVR